MSNSARVHILLVNDDQAELASVVRQLRHDCPDTLETVVFGPREAGAGNAVGPALLDVLAGRRPGFPGLDLVDVAFVDFAMPGLNGAEFLQWLNKELPLLKLPVVLVTKHDVEMIAAAVTAVEMGARGYVFTHSATYAKEIELSAQRVFQECQRERWTEALMEVSARLSEAKTETEICELLPTVLEQYNRHIKVFVRRATRRGGANGYELVAASANIPAALRERLAFVREGRFPMLDAAAKQTILRYNSLTEVADELESDDLGVCQLLSLDRGMAFPIGGAGRVTYGTACMYRRAIDPPFGTIEERYATLMVRAIASTLDAWRERQKGLAYTKFAEAFAGHEREDDLYRELVRHFHAQIHRAPDLTSEFKVTFKALTAGTDRLLCDPHKGHHVGAPRDATWGPSVYDDPSISSYVARQNQARLVNDFHEEADYHSTNAQMRSELCLPVARGSSEHDTVYGVINLESTRPGFYGEHDKEYGLALCRLAGHYVDRLRAARFLLDVLRTVSLSRPVEERIRASLDIVKALTGYHLLLFVLKGQERWIVADADAPAYLDKETFREAAEARVNGAGGMLLKLALERGEDTYYVPDLGAAKDVGFWTPEEVATHGEQLRSQAVFVMRAESQVVGALSLDFVTTYPLTERTLELLGYFTRWLAVMFIQTQRYDDLAEQVRQLDEAVNHAELIAQVWHKAVAELHSMSNLLETLSVEPSVRDSPKTARLLGLAIEGLEQLRGLPTRIKSVVVQPVIVDVDTRRVCKVVRDQLTKKAAQLGVAVAIEPAMLAVRCDRDILEMCVYQLLDNALDACRNVSGACVSVNTRPLGATTVELCVRDTGDNSTTPDGIIRPGQSTRSKGTGWGLYIVSKRARAMNGEFRITRAEAGSEAVVRLPRAGAKGECANG